MTILFRPSGDISKAPSSPGRKGLGSIFASDTNEMLRKRLEELTGLKVETDPDVNHFEWRSSVESLLLCAGVGMKVMILPRIPLPQAMDSPVAVIPGKDGPLVFCGPTMASDLDYLEKAGAKVIGADAPNPLRRRLVISGAAGNRFLVYTLLTDKEWGRLTPGREELDLLKVGGERFFSITDVLKRVQDGNLELAEERVFLSR